MSRTLLFCHLLPLLALGLPVSTPAAPLARTWQFDLKTTGTYKVQVQHDVQGPVPPGTRVIYTLHTREHTITRNDPYLTLNRTIPLITDIAQPQKISVVI